MGNQQSAEEGAAANALKKRQPTRLTKPRTNTSTSNLLLNAGNASRQSSKIELPMPPLNKRASMTAVAEPVEETPQLAKMETKQKRRSLFRSKTTQATYQAEETSKEKELEAWTAPLHRYSSTGTLSYEVLGDIQARKDLLPPLRTTRSASVRPYAQQVSRLSEIVEARSPSPETREGLKRLGVEEEIDDAKSSTVPERTNSDHSTNIPIPIRRRSLQTPGIATRQSSKDDPYRKSLPSQVSLDSFLPVSQISNRKSFASQEQPSREDLQKYYYDSSKPIESPLNELATLEMQRFNLEQPRTHTPNEMDYAHIGSFKLGSLRITNGACSPSPSARDARTIASHDDDYLTCSEGRHSEDNPYRKTYDLEMLKNFITDYNVEAPTNSRPSFAQMTPESPLRQRQDAAPEQTKTTTVQIPDQSLRLFDFSDTPAGANLKSPTRARELAQSYMEDIASSPFSFEESPPVTPHLIATSKNTAAEDNLFEEDLDSSLLQSAISGLDISQTTGSFGKTTTVRDPRESTTKVQPLAKADSGYSSNASLRSLKQRRSCNEGILADMNAPGLPEKIPPPTPAKEKRHSYMSLPTQRQHKDEAPATPPKEKYSYNRMSSASSLISLSQQYQNSPAPPSRHAPPVPLKHSSTTTSGQAPTPPNKTAEQMWAAAQAKPQILVIPKAQMPRILTHRQSMPVRMQSEDIFQQYSKPEVITVQGSDEVHNREIPPIPQKASKALDERVKHFPTPTHSYNHKPIIRSESKETLATIFSMASAEVQAEEIHRYDSLARIYENLPPGHESQRSRSKENFTPPGPFIRSTSRNITPQLSRRQSAENFSSQSQPQSRSSSRGRPRISNAGDVQAAFENRITSVNGISDSLGASPYDAAISMGLDSRSRTPTDASVVGTPMKVKRNTVIGMDSPAASQFARERSRQRSLSRRASWDRPVMQTPDSNGYSSSPPVPSLPVALPDASPSTRTKKMKSPPPVSLRASGQGSVGRKGPPPPAWASLSSAAREKMMQVCDSPPVSPRSPVFWGESGGKKLASPSPAPRVSPPAVVDIESMRQQEERTREEQFEAQRRGWARRRENAAQGQEGRKSVETEVVKIEDRIAQTQPKAIPNARAQSYFPPQTRRSSTMTTTTAPMVTTTTTTVSGFGGKTGSLKARRSWDTSTSTSIRGPSSTYSTYSESVYSNAPTVTSTSTATTSNHTPKLGLSRAQSYGLLVDRRGSYDASNDPNNPSSRRNSIERNLNRDSFAASLSGPSMHVQHGFPRGQGNNHSNPNLRASMQRQAYNGSLNGNGTGYGVGVGYRGPVPRVASAGSLNGNANVNNYRDPPLQYQQSQMQQRWDEYSSYGGYNGSAHVMLDRYNGGYGYGFGHGAGVQGTVDMRGIGSRV